jgi:hypothetical protein
MDVSDKLVFCDCCRTVLYDGQPDGCIHGSSPEEENQKKKKKKKKKKLFALEEIALSNHSQ